MDNDTTHTMILSFGEPKTPEKILEKWYRFVERYVTPEREPKCMNCWYMSHYDGNSGICRGKHCCSRLWGDTPACEEFIPKPYPPFRALSNLIEFYVWAFTIMARLCRLLAKLILKTIWKGG